jgi:hypothetical protein
VFRARIEHELQFAGCREHQNQQQRFPHDTSSLVSSLERCSQLAPALDAAGREPLREEFVEKRLIAGSVGMADVPMQSQLAQGEDVVRTETVGSIPPLAVSVRSTSAPCPKCGSYRLHPTR